MNDGKHERVPKAIFDDAEKYAKVRIDLIRVYSTVFIGLFRRRWKKPMMTMTKCSRMALIFFSMFN